MNDGDDRIVVFGAGGHARSVLSVLHAEARWHVVGLLEDAAETAAKTVLGHPVLGDRTQLAMLRRTGVDKGFVAIGDNRARGRIVDCLRAGGFRLISVIHPAAVCMLNTSIAAGSFVHALALVGAECEIGPGAIVQPFCSLGHESRIGSCVQFSPGVHVGGKARIGDYAFFGPGAVVYPGVTVGYNVSVGANSVINKDVADGAVVAGNPARIVRYDAVSR